MTRTQFMLGGMVATVLFLVGCDSTASKREAGPQGDGGSVDQPHDVRSSLDLPIMEAAPERVLDGGRDSTEEPVRPDVPLQNDVADGERDVPLPLDTALEVFGLESGHEAGSPNDVKDGAAGADTGASTCGSRRIMTPYGSYSNSDVFVQGATLEWKDSSTVGELQRMRDVYCINTVNLYGLEWISDSDRDLLFQELRRLGMKLVVRIEAYDTSAFAFQVPSDLEYIVNYYSVPRGPSFGAVIPYISDAAQRDLVAYFALNMPTDDVGVQTRLGGINSTLSKQRQPEYAKEFVRRMRAALNADGGFTNPKLYLGVFYGWDYSYELPSYRDSGADGYFINNYSYPAADGDGGLALPDETANDSALINQPRLQIVMDKFENSYSGCSQVIEYGFHTVEYNGWIVPNQTAGLVQTKAAKLKALKATTDYYRANFADVRGSVYFGYNVFKSEGTPPALLDWSLVYPGGD